MANEINLVHKRQFFKNAAQGGGVANGAKAYFYVQGSSTTLQDTYSDEGLTTPNLNDPLTADSNGRFGAVYGSQMPYHVIIKDSAGNTLVDDDGVSRNKTRIKAAALPTVHWADMEVYNTSDGHLWERNHDDTDWIDRGPIDGAGNLSTIAEVIALVNAAHTVTPATLFGLMGKGVGLTAGSTLTLDSGGGKLFAISGSTTTIDNINSSTDAREIILFFTTAQNISHGSGINTPTAATVYCPANSFARLIRYSSAWYLLAQYQMGSSIGPIGVASVQGLVLTNDSGTPNTKASIVCDGAVMVDSANRTLISGAQSLTVNLGVTGANGLDAGVQVLSTWYNFWIIGKADGTIAGLASTSATAPTMPSGYTFKVRVGAMYSDASVHLAATIQHGRRATYTSGYQTVTTTNSLSNTSTSIATMVPPTAVSAAIAGNCGSNASGGVGVSPTTSYGTTLTGSATPPYIHTSATLSSAYGVFSGDVPLVTAQTVFVTTGTAGTNRALLAGWVDKVNAT